MRSKRAYKWIGQVAWARVEKNNLKYKKNSLPKYAFMSRGMFCDYWGNVWPKCKAWPSTARGLLKWSM